MFNKNSKIKMHFFTCIWCKFSLHKFKKHSLVFDRLGLVLKTQQTERECSKWRPFISKTTSSQWVKFFTSASVSNIPQFFFSQFKENVACWIVYPKGILFYNSSVLNLKRMMPALFSRPIILIEIQSNQKIGSNWLTS